MNIPVEMTKLGVVADQAFGNLAPLILVFAAPRDQKQIPFGNDRKKSNCESSLIGVRLSWLLRLPRFVMSHSLVRTTWYRSPAAVRVAYSESTVQ